MLLPNFRRSVSDTSKNIRGSFLVSPYDIVPYIIVNYFIIQQSIVIITPFKRKSIHYFRSYRQSKDVATILEEKTMKVGKGLHA